MGEKTGSERIKRKSTAFLLTTIVSLGHYSATSVR